MKYTSKIRFLLIGIAIVPPLLIVLMLRLSFHQKLLYEEQKQIKASFEKAEAYLLSEEGQIKYEVTELAKDSAFFTFLNSKVKNENRNARKLKQIIGKNNFDYFYIVSENGEILFSLDSSEYNRDSIFIIKYFLDEVQITRESDNQGQHAGLTYTTQLDTSHCIFGGKYIDHTMLYLLSNLSGASVKILFTDLSNIQIADIDAEPDSLTMTILASEVENVAVNLTFPLNKNQMLYNTFLKILTIVTVCIVIAALFIGFYITNRTKREIDNLRTAFSKVASGEFDTTVMAYEQSEFSELADSFSEMVRELKSTQSKLSTAEKIATWQTVGQKLAHEIKNPLSPISIAADDIKSSYFEKLPHLDKTIDESTATIKKEVKRMTQLLDEFVSFARMKQSTLQEIQFNSFVEEIKMMYAADIEFQRLQIRSTIQHESALIDKDTLTQVCINLIKNGFESKENALVEIEISRKNNNIEILFSDNGPGFSHELLENSFIPFQTTKKNGSGLGLIICHRIMHDHNGTISLENKNTGGGIVRITIPIV